MARTLTVGLFVALAGFCFALRILHPGDIPFFADIPHFQIRLDEYLAAGKFPITAFQASSTSVIYGGGALWIFWVIRFLTQSMEGIAFVHMLLYSASAFAFLWIYRRRLDLASRWLVVWLCLSAPHFFYLSRNIWDNGFFFPLSLFFFAALDHLDRKNVTSTGAWLVITLVAGLIFNMHLQAVPLLVGVALTACWLLWRSDSSHRAKVLLPAMALALFSLTVTPYLVELMRVRADTATQFNTVRNPLWGDGRNLWWLLQKTLMFTGTYGINTVFEGAFPQFLSEQGRWAPLFARDYLGWIPKILSLVAILSLPLAAFRRRLDAFEVLTLVTFFSVILLLNLVNIPTEPHYFQPTWFLPFLALAIALREMARLSRAMRSVLLLLLVAGAGLNTVYSERMYAYVREHRGIRNGRMGPVYAEFPTLAKGICAASTGRTIPLDLSETGSSIQSFRFFQTRASECADKEFLLASPDSKAQFRVRFAAPFPSARMVWEKL